MKSLDAMAQAIERLQGTFPEKNDEIQERLEQIRAHIMALQKAIRLRPPTPGEPRAYRENLQSFARVTVALSEHPPTMDSFAEQLRLIEQDLSLKETFSSSSRGEPLSQIEAVIRTVDKDNRENGGYEIWYVPKGLEDYSEEYKRFDNLSTPAVMSLPPGNYVLWATKQNVTSDRRPLSLGEDGKSKREFTLVVK